VGRKARERANRKAAIKVAGQQVGWLQPVELRERYELGMNAVFDRAVQRSKDADVAPLLDLTRFRRDHVAWAASDADGMIRALDAGTDVQAYLVALAPDDPHARAQAQTLQVNWHQGFNGPILRLDIKPDRVSATWAGIFAIHELEHLYSMATGREVDPPKRRLYIEGEIRAYSVEITAADLVSDGRFREALRSEATRLKLDQWQQVAANYNTPAFAAAGRRLDKVISDAGPASAAEGRLRLASHIFFIGLFVIDNKQADPNLALKEKARFVEHLYDPLGVLPKF
jgi:hypothetical protein